MSNLPVITAAILGFCGVVYELVFAQTLSILFGQSIVQYSLTIGLFLVGMGIGAHASESWSLPKFQLWRTQLVLSLAVPIMWLGLWWLGTGGYDLAARALAYLMCVSVGAVTGTELPLLFRMHNRRGLILSADYLGMLLACIAFPLILLPTLGVFSTLFATALLNSLVMLSLRFRISLSAPVPVALAIALWFEAGLREWLSQRLSG
jgi:spermidine synthase